MNNIIFIIFSVTITKGVVIENRKKLRGNKNISCGNKSVHAMWTLFIFGGDRDIKNI